MKRFLFLILIFTASFCYSQPDPPVSMKDSSDHVHMFPFPHRLLPGKYVSDVLSPSDSESVVVTPTSLEDSLTNYVVNKSERDYKYVHRYAGVGANRGVIVLRFDDGPDEDYSIVWPALSSRNLPGEFAIIFDKVGTSGHTTWANLRTMQLGGMSIEVHCYSAALHDNQPTTLSDFILATKTGMDSINAQGFSADRFICPGPWHDSLLFDSMEKTNNRWGRFISKYFNGWESYGGEVYREFPSMNRISVNHQTGDQLTLSSLVSYIKYAERYQNIIELTFHSDEFDHLGYLTSADFGYFLDTLVDRRAKAKISVLSANGADYALPNTAPTNLLCDGNFDSSATGEWKGWFPVAGTPTVVDSGMNNSNCAAVGYSHTLGEYLPIEPNSGTLHFTAYAKSISAADTARIIVKTNTGTTIFDSLHKFVVSSSGWTKYDFIFIVPPQSDGAIRFYVDLCKYTNYNSGNNVYFSNIKLEKL